jgi:hypothetical protein
VIALHAFGDEPVDVQKLNPNNDLLRPLEMGSGWNTRFNLDGLVAYTGNAGPHYSYTQAFRLGALEGFTMVGTTTAPDGSHRRMYPASVETDVMKGVQHYVMKLRTVGLDGPSSVLVALLGVKGLRASYGAYELPWDKDNLIDRDLLILPDILIEPERDDLATLMRPAFDALWQAGGYERSFGYDAAGNWDPKAHR